jgi:hypothetical protein
MRVNDCLEARVAHALATDAKELRVGDTSAQGLD